MKEQKRFTDYTKKLRDMFPTWSKIRKDEESVGARFLSATGLQLADMEWYLNYASEQLYIGSTDLDQVDILYKTDIPKDILRLENFKLSAGPHEMVRETNLEAFLSVTENSSTYGALHADVRYYIDEAIGILYFREPLASDNDYPFGRLDIGVLREDGTEVASETLALEQHSVWNFFDEFGLLLGVLRLPGERNRSFKERILDVFRRPSNATESGLMNGIARELGLLKRKTWSNPSSNLTLYEERISVKSIRINGSSSVDSTIDMSGRIVLIGKATNGNEPLLVEYIAGLDLHELHDKSDDVLQEELYLPDGSASPALEQYANILRSRIPVFWGEWKWDEGFWQGHDELGTSYLPTVFDASIEGFYLHERRETNT